MKFLYLLFVLALTFSLTFAQASETDRSWNQPVEPFHIAGNIYYVGANEITSYLITTPKGHVLLDGGFKETVPQITTNIAKLGFKVGDVKYLLNSQAHYDHAAGLSDLKTITRAKMLASVEDAKLLARGGKDDPNFGDQYPFEPVIADKTFSDGWKLKLGGTTLIANVTPGHTKGCTTWTMTVNDGGKKLNVIFVCSTTAPGYNLVDNAKYPEIAKDFEGTFAQMKTFKVDIFLSAHASQFNLYEKMQALQRGVRPNPFIDPQGYVAYLKATDKAFRERRASQSKRP
ncbi:MAG: subclass B3 metallo-beta-lactamase [Pyrinomonadaceae bacterium]